MLWVKWQFFSEIRTVLTRCIQLSLPSVFFSIFNDSRFKGCSLTNLSWEWRIKSRLQAWLLCGSQSCMLMVDFYDCVCSWWYYPTAWQQVGCWAVRLKWIDNGMDFTIGFIVIEVAFQTDWMLFFCCYSCLRWLFLMKRNFVYNVEYWSSTNII